MDTQLGRSMPYSLEAEQAVLGSMIISHDALTKVMEKAVRSDDFFLQQHKVIFDALMNLFTQNTPIDLVTLSGELSDKLDSIGGISYIGNVANSVSTTENIKYYIDIVKNKSILRKLISASTEIADMSYSEAEDVSAILNNAEQKIFSILQGRTSQGFYHIRDVMPETIKAIENLRENAGKISGLPSGFKRLDAMTAGFQNTDLIILAARPGIGKTSFALNIAKNVALTKNAPVAIFSLEMSKEQLVNRLLISEAMVHGENMKNGTLSQDDMTRIAHALGKLVKAPIYIDDTPGISASEIRAKCRRLKLEKGLGMVVIDYLQLMQGSKKSDNRQQEISEISRSIKIIAKELNVPVITLSQLSRAAEARADKRPILSDLRESGAIEQDADIVMFLSRQSGEDVPPDEQNIARCEIAKHRNGATGYVDLVWRGEYTLFTDYEPER